MSDKSHTSATPTGRSNDESAEGLELMNDAAAELGVNFAVPIVPKKQAATVDGEETDEEREAREAAEIDENGDGPEERAAGEGEETETEESEEEKTAREAAELEEKTEESEEEKTAREAEAATADKNDIAKKEKADAASTIAIKLKDLDPAVRKRAQAVVNEVLDRVVAKERGESDRLGNRVAELTTELETTQKQKGPAIVGSVNPVFMADSADQIDTRVEAIEKFERWARKNEGGFEGDPAKGETSFSAEQIEARLDDLLHEKNKIIPAARANLQKRAEIDKSLREFYPEVFDPKTTEYAQVQQVLKALPELKQFADFRVIALKQILGDRALADLLKKKYEQKPGVSKDGSKTDPKALKKIPPRAPGAGSTAKGSVLTRQSSKPAAAAAVEKFTKGEGTLEDAVGALIG